MICTNKDSTTAMTYTTQPVTDDSQVVVFARNFRTGRVVSECFLALPDGGMVQRMLKEPVPYNKYVKTSIPNMAPELAEHVQKAAALTDFVESSSFTR